MKNILLRFVILFVLMLSIIANSFAQDEIKASGKVTDSASGAPLIGAYVIIKGTTKGTNTDTAGRFNLLIPNTFPLTLTISSLGYENFDLTLTGPDTNILVALNEKATVMGSEVVISASRVEENIIESPVTIEKMDILSVQASPAPDFFDSIAQMKGVQANGGSMTFQAINTRGFASIGNVRYVQLVDGMDTSAPLLNFPTGNLVGISELDVESVELVPGAASALYGPNAFNGIMIMRSKNPFEYQGLSASAKYGMTNSDAQKIKTGNGMSPLVSFNARYAKALNKKLAFKVNFAYLDAEDWTGNDYKTDRNNPESKQDLSETPDFDGLNLYGDEVNVAVNLAQSAGSQYAPLGTINFHRTGIKEEDLIEDNAARSIKADAALHYKIRDDIEAILQFKYGSGNAIYQGSEKYVINNFNQTFLKAEVKGDNFFARVYNTLTKDGDSYNLTALGTFANEALSSTSQKWAPEYVQTYLFAMNGNIDGVPNNNPTAAHRAARLYADRDIYNADGSPKQAYYDTIKKLRTVNLNENGAAFIDDSRLYHAEFNYNFKNQVDFMDIQIGGNFRRYDLFSDGTIFNETVNSDGSKNRVGINEYGFYTQMGKRILNDRLKLTGSLRYDKNENFNGRVTPRISGVYNLNASRTHNLRASFQTGFRNPSTQAQFIWFPTGGGILIGSTKSNASQYGVLSGDAYDEDSYTRFVASGGSFDLNATPVGGDPSLLKKENVGYVEPESLRAIEFGYKGVIAKKVLIDINYYRNAYENFITQRVIYNSNVITRNGKQVTDLTGTSAVTAYRPYVNAKSTIVSQGIGLGITAQLPKDFNLAFSYNYADFTLDESKEDSGFESQFNTPKNRYSFTLSNRRLTKNLGASIAYRYVGETLWQSSFGSSIIPAYGVLSASVSYKVPSIKSVFKLGATNLLGGDYRPNTGSGFVGQQYVLSITFDEIFK